LTASRAHHDSSGDGPPRIRREAAEQAERHRVVDGREEFCDVETQHPAMAPGQPGRSPQATVRAEPGTAREGLRRGPAIDPGQRGCDQQVLHDAVRR